MMQFEENQPVVKLQNRFLEVIGNGKAFQAIGLILLAQATHFSPAGISPAPDQDRHGRDSQRKSSQPELDASRHLSDNQITRLV